MLMIRFILLLTLGLSPILSIAPGPHAAATEVASICCGTDCQCGVMASCPCADSSSDRNAPVWPAVPPSERVTVPQLFDREPKLFFELDNVDVLSARAFSENQPVPPTCVGQRLSLLCLRLV